MWLESGWPFVRAALPDPPADVIEIGCGTGGGFVPALLRAGYAAVGIDPQAPVGPAYLATEFESYQPPRPVDAVVASTSLHHVADLNLALDKVTAALRPGGTAVVIEWASERFDEATMRWCFGRLPAQEDHGDGHKPGHGDGDEHDHEGDHNWLVGGRQAWLDSGQPWTEFLAAWRASEGLHTAADVIAGLNARLHQQSCDRGPYLFPDLEATTEADEQAAIEAGLIQAMRIRYVGTKPAT